MVVLCAACTSLPVTTDVNPTMSVANCHTYAFASEHVANAEQPTAYGNPLNAERLRVAIAANLGRQGNSARRPEQCRMRGGLCDGIAPGVQRLLRRLRGRLGATAGGVTAATTGLGDGTAPM